MQETSKGVEIALHFYCHFSGRKKIQEYTHICSTLMEKLLAGCTDSLNKMIFINQLTIHN